MIDQLGSVVADSSDSLTAGAVVGIVISGLLGLALFAAMIYVYSRIVVKAGYAWTWIFIMFVPIVNIVMLVIFALQEWPIQRELKAARGEYGPQYGGGQYPGGQYPGGPFAGGQYPDPRFSGGPGSTPGATGPVDPYAGQTPGGQAPGASTPPSTPGQPTPFGGYEPPASGASPYAPPER